MGHESIVYGLIELHYSRGEPNKYLSLAKNEIAKLPFTRDDDEWPFLNQEHFSPAAGYYKSKVITFGGSYKQVEYEWDQWLGKFEQLLSKLCWSYCHLHLRTEISGNFDYRYTSQSIYVGEPGMGEWQPPAEWRFSGGPRCNSSDDAWYDEGEKGSVWLYENGNWTVSAKERGG